MTFKIQRGSEILKIVTAPRVTGKSRIRLPATMIKQRQLGIKSKELVSRDVGVVDSVGLPPPTAFGSSRPTP